MPEVGVAFLAHNLHSDHALGTVFLCADYFGIDGIPETGPACAGVELGFRSKQRYPTADAGVGSGFRAVPVFSGEWWFGGGTHADLILFRSEAFFEFFLGVLGVFLLFHFPEEE